MYELFVESTFRSEHALMIRGVREQPHRHDWYVVVHVVGDELDEDGLLCDFHELQRSLEEVIEPFRDGVLNAMPPFDTINPSAERVARHIAERMSSVCADARRYRVADVTVSEAPGCRARYTYRAADEDVNHCQGETP
ncbi:MAG: 6-carboxytetrahydropterin synthase [Phycisphaerales bacterium]|nr:6-carboxytetrahydropterin synthase [Phycisphaerales bacterium]